MSNKQPNFIFLFSDQHRWDCMSYGANGVTNTPNLQSLADSGMRFNRAYCNAPLCSPSRAAIASGRYGMNSGAFTNLHKLPGNTPTFNRQLQHAGYWTQVVGKIHMEIHHYQSDLASEEHARYMRELGWNGNFEICANMLNRTGIQCQYSKYLKENNMFEEVMNFYNGWGYFMDTTPGKHPLICRPWPFEEHFQESHLVASHAKQFIQEHPLDQPYFLHLGFPGPHSPSEPHPRFYEQQDINTETAPIDNDHPEDWLPQARQGYRAMIQQMDSYIGDIIECVKARGDFENTIFIYSSDHGELAGDHGLTDKTSFYEGAVHVPFIMSGPGIQQGESDAMLELIDIGRTVCDLADVDAHHLDQGKSLLPVLNGKSKEHRESVYCEMGCDKMLYDGRYKLVWGEPTKDQRKDLGRLHLDKPVNITHSPAAIFDLQEDRNECSNLIGDEDLSRMMMAKLLDRINANTQTLPNLDRGEFRPFKG